MYKFIISMIFAAFLVMCSIGMSIFAIMSNVGKDVGVAISFLVASLLIGATLLIGNAFDLK